MKVASECGRIYRMNQSGIRNTTTHTKMAIIAWNSHASKMRQIYKGNVAAALRRYFQAYFSELKLLNFKYNFTDM